MKVIDIDKYLEDNGIKIVIKGKEYVVKDIPREVQKMLREEDPDTLDAVSKLLGAPKKDLEEYGVVALSKVIRATYENLLKDVASQEKASKS